MTNSETELDELKALQREAGELRSATRRKESTAELAEGQGSAASADAPAAAAPLEEATPESTAALEDVNEDAFDTGLVKILVLAKRDDVLQQGCRVDARALVTNLDAAHVVAAVPLNVHTARVVGTLPERSGVL